MILVGNKITSIETTTFINNIENIDNTPPNSTVLFKFDIKTMQYAKQNDVSYGVILTSIKDAIYANALNAKYIICDKELAVQLQEIATNYMFDSRILAIIKDDNELEEIALKNIDGIIYQELLK